MNIVSSDSNVTGRRRALIVNAMVDGEEATEDASFRASNPVNAAMELYYLAGAFTWRTWEVWLLDEARDGLHGDRPLACPDVLVLIGHAASLERMAQLAAQARVCREDIVVVAGGPAVRAQPLRAQTMFDYVFTGGMEQLEGIVEEVFGPACRAREKVPHYSLFQRVWPTWEGAQGDPGSVEMFV